MDQVLAYIDENRERYLEELGELIAIPSISTNPENRPDIERCARWIADHLTRIGLQNVQVCPTAGHPVVYADWLGAPGQPTVLLYGHYDVQPVDPVELWSSPPFKATVRGENIYARGTADDKGQIFIHFKSIEAYLKKNGSLPVNLKLLIEGEEEIGSEHLEAFVKSNRQMLKADLALISDTSMYGRDVPSICYGLRGLSYMELEVTGPKGDLHSGSFGGAIHNPIQALCEIVAQLHDKNGRVTIPGFYDQVRKLTKAERAAFKRLPWSDKKFAAGLQVPKLHGEKGFSTLERLWARPTLECNGIWGGFIAEGAKTVLPSKAYAKISMRLVPDQKSATIAKLFEKYVRKIAPKTIRLDIKYVHGGEAAITPLESPGMKAAANAVEKGFGKRPLFQREGGSIPIVVQFKEILGLDTVLLGFGVPDENAHAPDEFMTLRHFYSGIRTTAHFYNELPRFMANGHVKPAQRKRRRAG